MIGASMIFNSANEMKKFEKQKQKFGHMTCQPVSGEYVEKQMNSIAKRIEKSN